MLNLILSINKCIIDGPLSEIKRAVEVLSPKFSYEKKGNKYRRDNLRRRLEKKMSKEK
jgi:hypothetical protein